MNDDERPRPGHRRERAEPREVVSRLSDLRPQGRDRADEADRADQGEAPDDPLAGEAGDLAREAAARDDGSGASGDESREGAPQPGRLENAQAAASDLSRMGIDPRSLGLDAPAASQPTRRGAPRSRSERDAAPGSDPAADLAPHADDRPDDGSARAEVVALRPQQPAPATEVPPDAPRAPSQFEAAVARTSTDAPPSRTDPLRMLRTVARGLATPDAAASVQQERELVEAVRRRQTERRLVAFVSGKGGVGCTAVAVGVGTTLTAMREDRSVVVDVQQGTPSLGQWLGATGTRSVPDLVARRDDFEAPRAPSGLAVVDGPGWDHAIGRGEVSGALERLGIDHTFHLLDVGDDTGEAGHTALARADLVVLVGGPGPVGAAAAAGALDRIRYVNPQAARRVVSVLVCLHDATYRVAQRELAPGPGGFPGLVVPPEPSLQSGVRFDPAALTAATREAYLRVSAAVVTGGGAR